MINPRIALIHATSVAMQPVQAEFAKRWPEARLHNVLDDSLSLDLAAAGALEQPLIDRFVALTRYVHKCGAAAVMFTCSAFGPAIEAAQASVSIPVLKPNEAMINEALAITGKIAFLATFEPSIAPMQAEIEEAAARAKVPLSLEVRAVPRALTALQGGHSSLHDTLIAQAAQSATASEVIMLGQFSMASAASAVAAMTGKKVLTSPGSAVAFLKSTLQ